MFGLLLRYLFLAVLATGFVAALVFWRADGRDSLWAAKGACQTNPSPDCLSDLAVKLLMKQESFPDYLPEVGYLARLGRIDQAREVAAQWVAQTDNEAADSLYLLAPHIFAAAVREGAGFDAAWKHAGGGTDTRLLYIAALDLLGEKPYGGPFLPRPPVKAAYWDVARKMAQTLVQEGRNQTATERQTHISDAAHLFALLEDKDAVLRTVELLEPGKTFLLPEVFAVGGPRQVVQVLEDKGLLNWWNVRDAARTTSGAVQKRLFQQAFEMLSDREPAPKTSELADLVVEIARIGDRDQARRLAYRMPELARDKPGMLPMFAPLDAARALSVVGGDPKDIRAMLDLAQQRFPNVAGQAASRSVATGVVTWTGSGLADEANQEIARVEAELGDLGNIPTRMREMDDPVLAWGQVLQPGLSDATIKDLLAIVDQSLEKKGQRLIRAALAVQMASGNEDDRALELARPLAEIAEVDRDTSDLLWTRLGLIGISNCISQFS